MREVVSAVSSLDVDGYDEERQWFEVVRGARRTYCFTVDGPASLEPEDVPDEVTEVLLGAAYRVDVSVEGSASSDIPYAVRFARRLAQSFGGVVVDQQLGEVWAKGASRQASKPARGERIGIIELKWYSLREAVPSDIAARYLSLCRRLLPEALPRRFGEFEPLQHKLSEVGDEGFEAAWKAATSMLHFTASSPCIDGSMWAGPAERLPSVLWKIELDVHYQPFADDPLWTDALRRLFLALADHLEPFYASAEVTRGHRWNGKSRRFDGETEWSASLAKINADWPGLPPYPTWWAWYGAAYQPLVEDRLHAGQVTVHARGILHQLTHRPRDRDEITHAITRRKGLRRVVEWAPAELLTTVQPNDGRVRPIPLIPAPSIPTDLRG